MKTYSMKYLFMILALLCMTTGVVWAQGSETFTNLPATNSTSYQDRSWTGDNGKTWTATGARTDQTLYGKAICFGSSSNGTRKVTSPKYSGGIGVLTFDYVRGFTASGGRSIEVYINGVKIGDTITVDSSSDTVMHYYSYIDREGDQDGNIILEIRSVGSAQVIIDNIAWTAYNDKIITSGEPDECVAIEGTEASTPQSFNISGTSLTDDITLTAPGSYEISLSEGSSFGNSLTLTPNNGAVEATDIYVRLKSDLPVGRHDQSLTIVSGTITVPFALKGIVIKAAPTSQASNFSLAHGIPVCSVVIPSWHNPEPAPDGYLIKASDVGYSSIEDPVDGTAVKDGILVRNVSRSRTSYIFDKLTPRTKYYFKIFPYNNAGAYIRYNTSSVPQAEITTEQPPETFMFWSFNNNSPFGENNWSQPITSDFGGGSLGYSFTQAKSFGGTEVNMIPRTPGGVDINDTGSFAPQGGSSNENNGKDFILSIPTTDYRDISLSYATQRTNTGFNKQTLYYSLNGTDYIYFTDLTDIPSEYGARGFDFSDIPAVNDNEHFKVKIVLTDATGAQGNNRFDNIRITGKKTCTFETNEPVELTTGQTVTMTVGRANYSDASMPPLPNTSLNTTDYHELKLDLLDDEPWTVSIAAEQAFCAYYWQGNWHDAHKSGGTFEISVDGTGLADQDLFIVFSEHNPTLPVELSSFMVTTNSAYKPVVSWTTQSETAVNGFYILRGDDDRLGSASIISSLIPATNSSIAHSYTFVDEDIYAAGRYYYWLNVSDLNGSESYHGPTSFNYTPGDYDLADQLVFSTGLRHAYPNPFNPSTNIGFELAEEGEIKIDIYNIRGQLVRSFAPMAHKIGKGSVVWDGKDNNGNNLSSGVYHIRMSTRNKSFSRKVVLMK